MSEPKMWQVTAECAWATIPSAYGTNLQLVHKGGLLPEGTKELKHLIESGMVERFGDEPAGVPAVEPAAPLGPRTPAAVGTESDVDRKRADVAAKLPADGSAPHANSGKDVWVEYAVRKGMDRGEAEKADKADLVAALKG